MSKLERPEVVACITEVAAGVEVVAVAAADLDRGRCLRRCIERHFGW
jgi:hypothetical protein